MPDYLLVFCSCRNEEEARRIATTLVNEQLAACANISAPIESIYRWNEEIETARETMLLLKTTHACFDLLRRRIVELHSYEVPEVIATAIVAGSREYLAWIEGSVRPCGQADR